MSNKRIILLVVFLSVVVIGGLLLAMSPEAEAPEVRDMATTSEDSTASDSGVVRTIDGLHQYQAEENRHTVVGTTTVPTPCHELSTEVEFRASKQPTATISFVAEKPPEDTVCAQQIQEVRFKVTFNAPEDTSIVGGRFGEDQVMLNLRTVSSDRDLGDFDVYTKG